MIDPRLLSAVWTFFAVGLVAYLGTTLIMSLVLVSGEKRTIDYIIIAVISVGLGAAAGWKRYQDYYRD